MSEEEVARLRRRLERERLARKEAEALLEAKSRELWEAKVRLEAELEQRESLVQARTEEVKAEATRAEKANRAKSDFLSNMSHELRTPLNAILGFAQILEQSRKDPLSERQKKHVQRIVTGGEHLLALINDILDLARIEAGKLTLSLEPVNTRALLEDCLNTVGPMAQARGITVVGPRFGPSPLPWVQADLTRARQVLLNLLSNAIKYNRPNGTVTLATEQRETALRLTVTDTGLGIPADKQKSLFLPFSRLGQENSAIEGTGIGLTITKNLVEKMGGAIGFSSQDGTGSTFWVDLPISEKQGGIALTGVLGTGGDEDTSQDHVILYVEDNPANLALVEEVVEDLDGFRLISAHTGELGLEMARATPPDVILMDINLPGLDGFGALKALKADPRTAPIPVIALSADAMPSTVKRGQDAGFAAYLTKPMQIRTLLDTLRQVSAKGQSQ